MMNGKIVRIAELEIDPIHLKAYRALLAEEIAASIDNEPGVLMLHAVSEKNRPEQIRILEVYTNLDAYQAHLRTPHFLKYKTGTAEMVKALRLVDVDPVMMRTKALDGPMSSFSEDGSQGTNT
ncbi:quinol monooxygenase YgiN [Pararhizobium capsulatum DSM 1112]|uniref:Quinol monooxygenase YgiN n=1 Tax=Pararhizobium capsulatum DSM 1112 TaxID=1121113 RepID=A0ABU0BNC2_9HYPH|nr:putative quinol monooxygenase [Pararhizobium capsulatum]MDQ0319224.1 quinol monooxygenase YgiN [Pararhizobium capsulatum DSM 1112]